VTGQASGDLTRLGHDMKRTRLRGEGEKRLDRAGCSRGALPSEEMGTERGRPRHQAQGVPLRQLRMRQSRGWTRARPKTRPGWPTAATEDRAPTTVPLRRQAETATEAARAARGLYVASTERGCPLAETSTAGAARTCLRPVTVASEAR
jgi:hypothetical protein